MLKFLSFLKDDATRILFLIFVANIFYDDPTLFLYKRIIYSICIYYSLYEIIKFYYTKRNNENFLQLPLYYKVSLPLLLLFVLIALSNDLVNPNLKWITLLNNPYALMSVCPVFLLIIGSNTEDTEAIYKVFMAVIIVFLLVYLLPTAEEVKFYQGYICANAFIPLFFFSTTLNKNKIITYGLIIIGIVFSQISGYRIIALRILLFLSLYLAFTICKRFSILKIFIIAITCFCLYQFIANLPDLLYLFKEITGIKNFDDDDTRGFLWEEIFSELKGSDLVFGRGFLGTYFSEYFLMLLTRYREYADHYERFTVEVGFLQFILKGGFFWYILFITPILYTSLKGIFRYFDDKLTYFISIFLLTELLLMFIENLPYFSFQYSTLYFLTGFAIRRMYTISNNQPELIQLQNFQI